MTIIEPMIFAGLKNLQQQQVVLQLSVPDRILRQVSEFFKIEIATLVSIRKTDRLPIPRMIAIYKIREQTNLSLKEIGKIFSHRHHSSIINSLKTYNDMYNYDRPFREKVDNLEMYIQHYYE